MNYEFTNAHITHSIQGQTAEYKIIVLYIQGSYMKGADVYCALSRFRQKTYYMIIIYMDNFEDIDFLDM